jgi:hypothetical protein
MTNILTGTQFQFNCSERGAYTGQISNIEIDGLDMRDYPDFVDAYIMDARVDGRQATDEELDQMNDDGEFRYESVEASLY